MKLAAAVFALSLAACGGGPVTLTVTEPSSSVELVPGGTVDFAWTLAGGGAELTMTAIPLNGDTGPLIFDQDVPEGDGTFPWDGVDVDTTALPPDVYDIELAALVGGTADDTATRNVTVHGIHVTDPAPGDTATVTTTYDLKVTTVSLRPLDLTFSLGDHVIDTRSIGGEFVPFSRTIAFDGTDTDGVPLPAGTYDVFVDATDNAGLSYRVTGGQIAWQP